MERARLLTELEGYRDLERYLEHLARFTLYTRTRRDYERSLMRLTPEQRDALDEIRPGHDFLIRGGAGTGKTIVLLHAFDRARRERDAELGFGRPRMALLTYTTTLVKYDRYLAAVLHTDGVDDLITTADAFFLARLRRVEARARVDYAVVARLAASLNGTEFLTNAELATELEDFLFANAVTREEYIDNVVLRRGMRQPLSAQQRAMVWGVRARVIEEMERAGTLSKNWSRMRLIEHLERTPGDPAVCDVDLAYVDESQDLTAVDLKALKLMTRRGLVLAGDAGQTIYGVGSPYRRAGIDISGRTRVLRTSFRTTCPIQEAADRYRALTRGEEEEPNPQAFREGPVPELYTAATRDEMDRLLLARVALFVDTLGYDPENVTVLAPTRNDVARIGQLLSRAGRAVANIHDEAFAFSQAGAVRLSTLHSSKGLDFPVVLLYLPGAAGPGRLRRGGGRHPRAQPHLRGHDPGHGQPERLHDGRARGEAARGSRRGAGGSAAGMSARRLEPLARRPVRPVPARLPVPVPRRRERRLHHHRAAPRPGRPRRARAGVRRARRAAARSTSAG